MSAPATQAPNAKVQQLTVGQFLRMTKAKSIKIDTKDYTDNGSTSFRLPQAGLANILWVSINAQLTVSAGTISGGTWKTYPTPMPFAIIKRVRFGNNNSINMRDLSGWSWYTWIRNRYGIDFMSTGSSSYLSANNLVRLGTTSTSRPVPGAAVAEGVFNCHMTLPMPIGYNNTGDTGLIVLQQNATFYDLTIDWGQVSGGITATGPSTNSVVDALAADASLAIAASISCTVGMDWFEPVPGIGRMVSYFMSVRDQTMTPLIQGTNRFQIPQDDYYTTFLLEILNAGAPLAIANVSNLHFKHSGNVYDYSDDHITNLVRSYYQNRIAPQDGIISWDLGLRQGVRDRRDTIDAFDNRNVTASEILFDIGTTISGTNQAKLISESLRPYNQG